MEEALKICNRIYALEQNLLRVQNRNGPLGTYKARNEVKRLRRARPKGLCLL